MRDERLAWRSQERGISDLGFMVSFLWTKWRVDYIVSFERQLKKDLSADLLEAVIVSSPRDALFCSFGVERTFRDQTFFILQSNLLLSRKIKIILNMKVYRCSSWWCDRNFSPIGDASLAVPDSVVLLVVRSSGVPGLPPQSHLELGGRARYVVRSVRLSTLDH